MAESCRAETRAAITISLRDARFTALMRHGTEPRLIDSRLAETFLAVCKAGSFELAAERLGITQPAVSQRIRSLETLLGNLLVARTRPVLPTAAGRTLLHYMERVALLEDEALHALMPGGHTPPEIAIGVNADSLATWFPGALAAALRREPYQVRLLVDDQTRTHALVEAGDAIGCVTGIARDTEGLRCVPLGEMPYVCVCTPGFAARHAPGGVTADMLRAAPALTGGEADEVHFAFVARYGLGRQDFPRHAIPSPDALFDLIRMEAGYGWVPVSHAEAGLQAGQLVQLVPDVHAVSLNWLMWQNAPPRLRAFADTLAAAAQQALARR